jgi:hypothetical protein
MIGNLTGKVNTCTFRSSVGRADEIKLVINARVETSPAHLDEMVHQELEALGADMYTLEVLAWRFLQPGRPQPTHRFTEVVV